MSKAILLSIQPQWVEKILNGEKTIEVRRKFPKDFVGWVYIYCTKGRLFHINNEQLRQKINYTMNGKVVARFWCNKVEEIFVVDRFLDDRWEWEHKTNILREVDLLDRSCLTIKKLNHYLNSGNGYAIHISKLEIFDRPKELGEFHKIGYEKLNNTLWNNCCTDRNTFERLDENYQIKAPQNYCYVEMEEN